MDTISRRRSLLVVTLVTASTMIGGVVGLVVMSGGPSPLPNADWTAPAVTAADTDAWPMVIEYEITWPSGMFGAGSAEERATYRFQGNSWNDWQHEMTAPVRADCERRLPGASWFTHRGCDAEEFSLQTEGLSALSGPSSWLWPGASDALEATEQVAVDELRRERPGHADLAPVSDLVALESEALRGCRDTLRRCASADHDGDLRRVVVHAATGLPLYGQSSFDGQLGAIYTVTRLELGTSAADLLSPDEMTAESNQPAS